MERSKAQLHLFKDPETRNARTLANGSTPEDALEKGYMLHETILNQSRHCPRRDIPTHEKPTRRSEARWKLASVKNLKDLGTEKATVAHL